MKNSFTVVESTNPDFKLNTKFAVFPLIPALMAIYIFCLCWICQSIYYFYSLIIEGYISHNIPTICFYSIFTLFIVGGIIFALSHKNQVRFIHNDNTLEKTGFKLRDLNIQALDNDLTLKKFTINTDQTQVVIEPNSDLAYNLLKNNIQKKGV